MRQELSSSFTTRQYMLAGQYELYYYSDQVLQLVPVHAHDFYEFYFFLDGNVTIRIRDRLYPLHSGDVVIIPPGVMHQAMSGNTPAGDRSPSPPYRRFVLWISPEYLEHLMSMGGDFSRLIGTEVPSGRQRNAKGGHVLHLDEISFNSVQARVFSLLEEINTQRYGWETFVSLGFAGLLMQLTRIAYEQENKESIRPGTLYESTVRYIENHIEEQLTLDNLSDRLHVSKYHLSHLFKEKIGISLHRYITDKRLSLCLDALYAGEQVGDACLKFGFTDYSSFYRAFVRRYGISPRQYMQQHRDSGKIRLPQDISAH